MRGAPDELLVGFFESARYPDGTPVAQVAAINEFGAGAIPERPFFRQAMAGAKRDLTPKTLAALRRGPGMVVDRAEAGRIGLFLVDRLQVSITTLRSPPNAPSTVKAKGSSNPLIDTAFMRNSATWRVE